MTNQYAPLHVHTFFSLLDGLNNPKDIAKKCKEGDMPACAVTDHGNMSGIIQHVKACKDKKNNIKPICGNEFYICSNQADLKATTNRELYHLVVLAKGLDGWKNLVKATSHSNFPQYFYYKPRLDLSLLSQYADGKLIVISGHPGSELCNVIFSNPDIAYSTSIYDECKKLVRGDWEKRVLDAATKYMNLFGKENFFLECQLVDQQNMPAALIATKIFRHISNKYNIPRVATPDAHYLNKEDAKDQRVLLASRFRTNLVAIEKILSKDSESDQVMGFFKSNNYHLPTSAEMYELHKGYEIELENTLKVADMCGTYDILRNPITPVFCDDQNNVLRSLCSTGWNQKIENKIDKLKHDEYKARLEKELKVLIEANLAGYFLTVHDYVNQARSRGELVVVRGSGTGCLVSYLIGISDVDPLPPGLLFERFYNAGRNTKDHVSMPDIDCDFESNNRHLTVEYVEKKHGVDRVSQVATFHRLQGRSAIKAVLRAHDACDFNTMNRITKFIPDEAKISDDLQLVKDAGQEPSVLQWALENNSKDLSEFCTIDDNGNLRGDFASYFEQAKRLEGCKEKRGIHAAALIISNTPLHDMCPMLYDDKTGKMYCGMEFGDLENMGLLKYDILASDVLDKLNGVKKLLATGEIH